MQLCIHIAEVQNYLRIIFSDSECDKIRYNDNSFLKADNLKKKV